MAMARYAHDRGRTGRRTSRGGPTAYHMPSDRWVGNLHINIFQNAIA